MTGILDDVLKAIEAIQSNVKYPARVAWVGGAALNHLLRTDAYDPRKTYIVTPDDITEETNERRSRLN